MVFKHSWNQAVLIAAVILLIREAHGWQLSPQTCLSRRTNKGCAAPSTRWVGPVLPASMHTHTTNRVTCVMAQQQRGSSDEDGDEGKRTKGDVDPLNKLSNWVAKQEEDNPVLVQEEETFVPALVIGFMVLASVVVSLLEAQGQKPL